MARTLGIHWAATTYGTWLHGDPRGSWHQGRLTGADPFLEAAARASMAADAIVLDAIERELVANALGDVIREQRHRVYAATVQATHVHLVFAPLEEDLTNVVARLKRRSSMAVLARRRAVIQEGSPARMAGLYNRQHSRPILGRNESIRVPRSLWTGGKFPVFIFDERHLANAIEYVRDHNRRIGLPADPFDWIDALYLPSAIIGERVLPGDANVQLRL